MIYLPLIINIFLSLALLDYDMIIGSFIFGSSSHFTFIPLEQEINFTSDVFHKISLKFISEELKICKFVN